MRLFKTGIVRGDNDLIALLYRFLHDKQALVLVNLGGAKGSDILALSDAVRASVHEKFGIDIHPEVNLIN